MINWNILRPRGKSASSGASTASFKSGWGSQYELYTANPRQLYMGPNPERDGDVANEVRRRMQRQGKYNPATGIVLYNRDARGQPLNPGQPAQQVHESQCDMGHLIDAVAWWNSNGRLTYPQSPEVLKFMNNPNNYELEPSVVNQLRGAEIGARYLPPIG